MSTTEPARVHAPPAAIDELVATLARMLHGPGRLKADLLTEARHGLADAAHAYRADGLAPPAAERRAVADFGPVRDVAPVYQEELVAGAARRFALWLAAIPVLVTIGADQMWRGAPWTGSPRPAGYLPLAETVDASGYVLTATALAAYAWLLWAARRGRRVTGVARVVAAGGLTAVTALLLAGGALYLLTVRVSAAALTWQPMLLGGLLIVAVLGSLGAGAARCLAYARHSPVRPRPRPAGG
ncbi:MAG TPA: permease prefix domain 1-containing protein [Pilimelia sp.]|nr:permease prefix domain 1-containing protein [Pilimelia sp.]